MNWLTRLCLKFLILLVLIGAICIVFLQIGGAFYQGQLEAYLKSKYNVTVDLAGATGVGFDQGAVTLKQGIVRYGDPVEFSLENVEVGLGDFFALKDSFAKGTPVKVALKAEIYEGEFDAVLNLTSQTADILGTAEGIEMAHIMPSLKFDLDSEFDLKAQLGDDVIRTINGQASIKSAGGDIGGRAINLWGGDVFKSLLPDGKTDTKLLCLAGQLDIENGIGKTDSLIINTQDVIIAGAGTIDFNTNTLDLVLTPHPKDLTLLSLATPVTVRGDINSPNVSVSKVSVMKKIAGFMMGGINPATVILNFADLGETGTEDDCYKTVKSDIKSAQE